MQQPTTNPDDTRSAATAEEAEPGKTPASESPLLRQPIHSGVIPVNPLLFYAFSYIARRRIRRNFGALRIAHLDRFPRGTATPLIVYLNHPSWWDPLTCIALAPHLIGRRRFYGPIETESLKRYGIFSRLGLFPVQINSARGAAQFLRASEAVLAKGDVLGLTPQGRFTDVRLRPPGLKAGLGALLTRLQRAGKPVTVVPLAVEYTFWDERLPEILVNVGAPLQTDSSFIESDSEPHSAADWTHLLDRRLASTQDELSALAQSRDESGFLTLLRGSRGEAGIYGVWHRLLRKRKHHPSGADGISPNGHSRPK